MAGLGEVMAAYLGDGVYIEVTGMGFALFTSDGVTRTNEIVLDEPVYTALREYCDRVLQENPLE